MIGSKLSNYEITAHLGSGGMGDVYQASDVKLGRSVAIKVLPHAFASDPDRVARFSREARVLASLNHPNIAAIYGLEESSGQNFLVMELVGGETLAARIARGRIPLDDAVFIAKQILEALEAAHDKGIIHRDLKPANIKITMDGKVKVLDFGLAKALETEPSNAAISNSPTLSMAATNAGVVLGTAAYMSPEQAKGRALDRRSDIFAFGCVFYEMLAGRAAFEGDDVADILGSVLKTEPNWSRLPADVPEPVWKVLRLCLEKNPKNRRSDASDVRIDIDQAMTEAETAQSAVASAPTLYLTWMIAAVMAIAFSWIAVVHFTETRLAAPEMRLEILVPPTSAPLDFALSPDGRSLAFVAAVDGVSRLWVRRLDKTEGQPLPGTQDASYPFWSADNRSIGFFASGKLKRIDVAGGQPQMLATTGSPRGGTWNAEGTILFAPTSAGPLFRIAASGGEAVPVTSTKANQPNHRFPEFLPDGHRFLFYVQSTPEVQGIYIGSIDGGEPKRLTAAEAAGSFLKPDQLVFLRNGALVVQRLDLAREELVGNVEPLADAVGVSASVNHGGFSVSASGGIAYRGGGAVRTQLEWYDRTGKQLGVAGEPDSNGMIAPEISPDGRQAVIDRTVQGNRDVYLLDLLRGVSVRFTSDPSVDGYPIWSPDGKLIAFESNRKGIYNLYTKPSSRVGAEEPLYVSPNNGWPQDWSRDGRFLLYHEDHPKTLGDIWALPLTGTDRTPILVANTSFSESTAKFSPDGHYVAYDTDESGGQPEIVVQPFPVPSGKWQVSNGGGIYPRWRSDGKELYFIAADGKLTAATIHSSASSFEAETPTPLFQTRVISNIRKHQYAVSVDGRFLVNQTVQDSTATPITLILNWKPSR